MGHQVFLKFLEVLMIFYRIFMAFLFFFCCAFAQAQTGETEVKEISAAKIVQEKGDKSLKMLLAIVGLQKKLNSRIAEKKKRIKKRYPIQIPW